MSVCIYLPNGKVGFIFARPEITDNSAMRAGGMEIEIVKPFRHSSSNLTGKFSLWTIPFKADQARVFFQFQSALQFELTYEGVSPMYGGRVREDGSSLEIDPEKSFAKAL